LTHLVGRADSNRMLELTVKETSDLTAAISAIEGITDVQKQSIEAGTSFYRILQQPGQNRSEAVSRTAAAAGATILLLRPVEYSLEDVFFELTQKAALEEGESK